LNGRHSSLLVNVKKESPPTTKAPSIKKESKVDSTPTADTPKISIVKKEPITTPVVKKESKSETIVNIKKEPSPPKRKNTHIDSDDDDLPLVRSFYIFFLTTVSNSSLLTSHSFVIDREELYMK
jgi:hypothetical protein